MIAVDTNIVVRLLTNDDPEQVAKIKAMMASDELWIGVTVLLEVHWVLRSVYGSSEGEIAEAFRRLLGMEGLVFQEDEAVHLALDGVRNGLSFADSLHLALAEATVFATFDARLLRHAAKTFATPEVISP